MTTVERKQHWEHIYASRAHHEVSWFQSVPDTSLHLIRQCDLATDAAIIDVGGGSSSLADHLLAKGYRNITVLDLSRAALEGARGRMGDRQKEITWIEQDVLSLKPRPVDLWHDRAAFHFMIDPDEITAYVRIAADSVQPGGFMIIATFSTEGPTKCSGLEINQYSRDALQETFGAYFDLQECVQAHHRTPADKVQDFVFCRFQRKRDGNYVTP